MKVDIDFNKPRVIETPEDLVRLQKDCATMVRWWIWRAKEKFGLVLPEPKIRFDLMGETAGTANAGLNLIRFSPVLLRENPNKFLIQTTGHEVGHIVTRNLHTGKIDPHGDEWRNVMWAFGLRADTCHTYDTSNVPSMRGRKRREPPQSPTIRNKDGTVTRFAKGVIITEL